MANPRKKPSADQFREHVGDDGQIRRVRHRNRNRLPPLKPLAESRSVSIQNSQSESNPETAAQEDHKVGFCSPPLDTRFRKGRSGNPKGRPKGVRNLKTEILEEISERITIRENGKARKVSKLRGLVKRLIGEGLQGNVRAMQLALLLLSKLLPEPEESGEPNVPLAEEDVALILEFAGRQPAKKGKSK